MQLKKPIQLASGGYSPLPFFPDIVNPSNFSGTILAGVTPRLFFSTTNTESHPWEWPQARIDFFHKRTNAQHLNYILSIPPIQKSFEFGGNTEGIDDTRIDRNIRISKHINDKVINNSI